MLGVIGLIAALYHVLNHAVFKGLLFLGAGAVLYRTHERDLERMGGLIHRMPVTAALFLVVCISISALPPFNGFVSEWLTFQTALQTPKLESGVLRAILPIAAALLALTGALAAAAFVKVYGVAFLGKARDRRAAHAREVPAGMLVGMGMLAVLCLVLGVLPTTVIRSTRSRTGAAARPGTAESDGAWLAVAHAGVGGCASYSAPLVLAGSSSPSSLVACCCGATPIRSGAAPPGTAASVRSMRACSTPRPPSPSRSGACLPGCGRCREQVEVTHASAPATLVSGVRHQLHIADWSWLKLYEPIGRLVLTGARLIGRLHSGHIRTYLMYTFGTLLLLLWIVT